MHDETIEHLFIQCDYVRTCRDLLSQNFQIIPDFTDLQGFSQWLCKPLKGAFRGHVVQSVFAALLYHVWMQRNGAIWYGCIAFHDVIVRRIKHDVFLRITGVLPRKVSQRDKD